MIQRKRPWGVLFFQWGMVINPCGFQPLASIPKPHLHLYCIQIIPKWWVYGGFQHFDGISFFPHQVWDDHKRHTMFWRTLIIRNQLLLVYDISQKQGWHVIIGWQVEEIDTVSWLSNQQPGRLSWKKRSRMWCLKAKELQATAPQAIVFLFHGKHDWSTSGLGKNTNCEFANEKMGFNLYLPEEMIWSSQWRDETIIYHHLRFYFSISLGAAIWRFP